MLGGIEQAREFAIKAHREQQYGKGPYFNHLQDVVNVLVRFKVRSHPVLIAAWLHDALEDTPTTKEAIADTFGPEVLALVVAVTDEPGSNRKERALRTYPKIRRAGTNAVILKLADRIANTEHCVATKSPMLKMYRSEFLPFFTALFASGECDSMWERLRYITLDCPTGEGDK